MRRILLLLFLGVAICCNATKSDTLRLVHNVSKSDMLIANGGMATITHDVVCPVNKTILKSFNNWITNILSTQKMSESCSLIPCLDQIMIDSIVIKDKAIKENANIDCEIIVERVYEKDNYITFYMNMSVYEPGQNPILRTDYITINKNTGKLLTWDFLINKKYLAKFKQVVVDEISRYYGVTDFSNLKMRLKKKPGLKIADWTLPQNAIITNDGIIVLYKRGELSDVTDGQPMAIIPLNTIKRYMTKEGKNL